VACRVGRRERHPRARRRAPSGPRVPRVAQARAGAPVLTEAGREAGFTNELGVDGTVRHLRTVLGLRLLQECQRTWAAHGLPADLSDLLAAAGRVPAYSRRRRRRPPLPAAGRRADPRRAGVHRDRADPAAEPGRDGALHPRQPGAGLPARGAAGRGALGPRRRRGAPGRRRGAQHADLPAHRRACGLPVVAGPGEAATPGDALVQTHGLGGSPGGWRDSARCCTRRRRCAPTARRRPPTAPGGQPSDGPGSRPEQQTRGHSFGGTRVLTVGEDHPFCVAHRPDPAGARPPSPPCVPGRALLVASRSPEEGSRRARPRSERHQRPARRRPHRSTAPGRSHPKPLTSEIPA
jgi:hypothetical protein